MNTPIQDRALDNIPAAIAEVIRANAASPEGAEAIAQVVLEKLDLLDNATDLAERLYTLLR